MSTLLQNAKTELRAAGMFDLDADYGGTPAFNVVSLIETFLAAGHSGGSADITLAAFERLVRHKPLTPLLGDDGEWTDRSAMYGRPLWQNNRYPRVFKDKKNAWIVLDQEGSELGDGQVKYITFPYTVE